MQQNEKNYQSNKFQNAEHFPQFEMEIDLLKTKEPNILNNSIGHINVIIKTKPEKIKQSAPSACTRSHTQRTVCQMQLAKRDVIKIAKQKRYVRYNWS